LIQVNKVVVTAIVAASDREAYPKGNRQLFKNLENYSEIFLSSRVIGEGENFSSLQLCIKKLCVKNYIGGK
jgi:hypothetical protein